MKSAAPEGTGSLEKALDVLEAIGTAPDGIGPVELSERLSLPRTTLYRILGSLTHRGIVRRDSVRRVYRLGYAHLERVREAYLMPDLVAAAGSELRSLRDITGETSYLAVRDGNQVMSLERCEGAHSARSSAALGRAKPLHCTSQGKAILSALPRAEREALVRKLNLEALTRHSITDRRRLAAELDIIATRGYAVDDEEIVLGTRCVGAPIIDSTGTVRGALSVAGPAYRLTRARIELLGSELAEAARRVGARLGAHVVPQDEGPVATVPGPWAFHGAFPCWDGQHQKLYWADTLAPAVHVVENGRDRILATLEAPVTGLLPHAKGLVVAQHNGWVGLDYEGQLISELSMWRCPTPVAFAVDATGGRWASCGTRSEGWKVGALRDSGQFQPHWSFDEPVTALAWSGDGELLYAAAPESGTIFMMQRGSAQVRRFAAVSKGSGELGGLTIDADGGVWATMQDGWSVMRFAEDGNLSRLLSLPVPSPTDLVIGGAAMETLYITSSRHALSREAQVNAPRSGQLFSIDLKPQARECA